MSGEDVRPFRDKSRRLTSPSNVQIEVEEGWRLLRFCLLFGEVVPFMSSAQAVCTFLNFMLVLAALYQLLANRRCLFLARSFDRPSITLTAFPYYTHCTLILWLRSMLMYQTRKLTRFRIHAGSVFQFRSVTKIFKFILSHICSC